MAGKGRGRVSAAVIQSEIERRLEKEGVTVGRVLREFAGIAFDEGKQASHRLRALENLARILGLYTEQLEVRIGLTPDERRRRIQELQAQLKVMKGKGGGVLVGGERFKVKDVSGR